MAISMPLNDSETHGLETNPEPTREPAPPLQVCGTFTLLDMHETVQVALKLHRYLLREARVGPIRVVSSPNATRFVSLRADVVGILACFARP